MTVKMKDVKVGGNAPAWLDVPVGGMDVTYDETMRFDALSFVRHIMRERNCDMVPVVVAFVRHPENRWGHNATIEVQYAKCGWRAIYAGKVGGKVTNVTCYMD